MAIPAVLSLLPLEKMRIAFDLPPFHCSLARSLLSLMISSSRLWAIKNFARRRFANGHVMFIDDIHSVRKREGEGCLRAVANVASLTSLWLNETGILLH